MSFFEEKVKKPFTALLTSGASPQNLALSIAFGVTCGIFPIPGITSVPVFVAVFLFRLNPVAPLLVNYLVTPLNLASFPVFLHYGQRMFGSDDGIEFSPTKLMEGLRSDTLLTLSKFQYILWNGILMWLVFLPFATIFIYLALLPILKMSMKKLKSADKKSN